MFVFREVSAGCYRGEAIRDTHHSLALDGFESAIARLLQETFELELGFGTSVGEAAFHVTAAYQKHWHTEPPPDPFGSWLVWSHREPRRALYDGGASRLALYRQPDEPSWQWRVSELLLADSTYFQALTRL